MKAIIGASGFVGSNLVVQRKFDKRYGSANISEIGDYDFDEVVIAAPSAVKWWANKHPEEDKAHVRALMEPLKRLRARTVLLFSTVDVYPTPFDVDENSAIDASKCQPYGRNRLELERFARDKLGARVIRLPGLFGDGLKKNPIFDFLTNHEIEKIDSRHQFQMYSLDHIGDDVSRFLASGVELLNLTVEPIKCATVAEICLGRPFVNEVASVIGRYDFRSIHAAQFGGQNGYLYDLAAVSDDLARFVARFSARKTA